MKSIHSECFATSLHVQSLPSSMPLQCILSGKLEGFCQGCHITSHCRERVKACQHRPTLTLCTSLKPPFPSRHNNRYRSLRMGWSLNLQHTGTAKPVILSGTTSNKQGWQETHTCSFVSSFTCTHFSSLQNL